MVVLLTADKNSSASDQGFSFFLLALEKTSPFYSAYDCLFISYFVCPCTVDYLKYNTCTYKYI